MFETQSAVAKQRIEQTEPPPSLPAATLFLDDIEEIGKVFMQAHSQLVGNVPDSAQLTYRADNWSCDSVDDLKELGAYNNFFEVRVEGQFPCTFYHIGGNREFAAWITGAPSDVAWAVYGRVSELVKRRSHWWYSSNRQRIIFQKSFEYTGLSSVLKRHGWQIAIAVITAIVTFSGTEGVKWLFRYFHGKQVP